MKTVKTYLGLPPALLAGVSVLLLLAGCMGM